MCALVTGVQTCALPILVLRVRAVDVAVRDAGAVPPLAQPRADPFREVDRPVLAAGTADSDGEIGLALALVARQQDGEETEQIVEERPESGIRHDIRGDARVPAGASAGEKPCELQAPMRTSY